MMQIQRTSSCNNDRGGLLPDADVFSIIARINEGSICPMNFGDIANTRERSALGCQDNSCFWPKARNGNVYVPYVLSTSYNTDEQAVIASAIQEFTTLTCIRFIPRTTETDYINIKSVDGCWSYLGRIGGPQDLSLLKGGCVSKGISQHELNHALGFVHEQTRSDRDNYVDINWSNIPQAVISNFEKSQPETNNLGLTYDYTSVMHYGRFAFTNKSDTPTIIPKPDPNVAIGQRYGLSSLDIEKIKKLYQCDMCSFLYYDLTGSLGSSNVSLVRTNNIACVFLIRIPADKVFLRFSVFDIQNSANCLNGYMKVYDGASNTSPVLLGKACGKQNIPLLVASGSMMLVEYFSAGNVLTNSFKASYEQGQCGSTITTPTGLLSSPNYPFAYPPSSNCSSVIVAPTGYKITLVCISFSLEASTNCVYDYLLIIDDASPTKVIKRLCGSQTTISVTSISTRLMLQFISDKSIQSKGFQFKYTIGK